MKNRTVMAVIALVAVAIVWANVRARATSPPDSSSGVVFQMADQQPGAPLAILSDKNTQNEGAFAEVSVKNNDQRVVRSVTLGVLVHRPDVGAAADLRAGTPTAVEIAPGKTADVETRLLPMSVVNDLANEGTNVVAEVGILAVTFADESRWQYDVKAHGRFSKEPIHGGPLGGTCSSLTKAAISRVLNVVMLGRGSFRCNDTGTLTLCTNYGSSCHNSFCSPGDGCPDQICGVSPNQPNRPSSSASGDRVSGR